MYNVKSLKAEEFISDEEIKETLEYAEANKNKYRAYRCDYRESKAKKGTHTQRGVSAFSL